MKLSEKEKLVLKLYRECDSVIFYKHNCEYQEAKDYAEMLGEPREENSEDYNWYNSKRDKIELTAFYNKNGSDSGDCTEPNQDI